MKTLITLAVIILSLVIFSSSCFAIDAWPGSVEITIATLSDASGVVWHEERQSLFVVQNTGTLDELDQNGGLKDSWAVPGDLEGITLAENDRYLYIGVENPDSILEFDLQAEALTGKSWNLTTWMTGPDNSGLEGLSYHDGYFYAGLQADGKIYVFDVNLSTSGDVSFIRTITPDASYTDISGLDYNSDTGITYAIFDTANALIELNAANETVKHYSLPGTAQEGFAMRTNCMSRTADVYITNDDTGQVVKYTGYPVACLDADSDGVSYTQDCNDYDATISSNHNYYRDADEDGLGDVNSTMQACSLSALEGYVADSSDPVDIIADGRQFYINGAYYDFFTVDPITIKFTTLNYYSDDYEEVIAVGLTKKRAYITVARVQGNNVSIVMRRMLKKKYKTASITTQIAKNKFITRFNGRKKYIWKIRSSGSFSRSR
jgi:hypothetical protein